MHNYINTTTGEVASYDEFMELWYVKGRDYDDGRPIPYNLFELLCNESIGAMKEIIPANTLADCRVTINEKLGFRYFQLEANVTKHILFWKYARWVCICGHPNITYIPDDWLEYNIIDHEYKIKAT
jgi:hypothetical protein